MSGMRKWLCLLFGVAFAAFALPAAADKVYQQTTTSSPSPLTAGATGQSVTIQVNNISSDTGNANSSSMKLNAPTGYTVQQVSTVSRGQTKNLVPLGGGYTATVQILSDGSAVWISNIQVPLKPFGPPLVLAMTVDVSCSATNAAWLFAGVWTGSNFGGQTFALNVPTYPQYHSQYPSTTTTSVSGICATYNLTSSTASVNSGGGAVSLTFTNTSPAGGGSIGSLQIGAPTNFTITGGTASNGGTVTPISGGTAVTVTGGSVVGPGGVLTLNLTVTTPNCNSAQAAAWGSAQVYVNSNLTGQQFSGPGTGYPSTGITGLGCTISIVNQPTTTFAGYPITNVPYSNPNTPAGQPQPVTVSLQINGAAAPDGTTVNLSVSIGSCSLSNASATTTGGAGIASFDNLSSTAADGCKLVASTTASGVGSSTPSNSFDIKGKQGDLTCASTGAADAPVVGALDPLPPTDTPLTSGNPANDWGIVRGLNLNGTCGDMVPYSFSYSADDHSAVLLEDSLGQHTSVEYVILWKPVNIDDDGWAGKQPCVAWGATSTVPPTFTADPVYGCTGDYSPALLCASDNVDGGSAVMPTIPNQPPYNLAGTETQYKYGIDPDTNALRKAKVCVANFGANAYSPTQVQYWTKIIDQSDGGVRLP